jgi:nucleoid-associated protein YgaU
VQRYVVQRGDSIWKIFQTMGKGGGGGSWKTFLSNTSVLNGLDDPDTILPGKVLNIAPREK